MRKVISVPGPNHVKLVLDTEDEATPAMVYAGEPPFRSAEFGRFSSTYDCATGTGCVDDEFILTEAQMKFLEAQADEVEKTFEVARPEGWDR